MGCSAIHTHKVAIQYHLSAALTMTAPILMNLSHSVLRLAPMLLFSSALLLNGCAPAQSVDPASADVEVPSPQEDQAVDLPKVELTAEVLHQLLTAELAFYRNDILTSIEILEKLAFETSDPRIVEAVSLRAISQNQFDVASNTSDLWVTLQPESAAAWFANAVSMFATQKYDRAVEGFQRMLQLSKESEQNDMQRIGRTLSSGVDPELAYDLFARVIADRPDSLPGRLLLIELAVNAEKNDALIEELIADGLAMNPQSDEFATSAFIVKLHQGNVTEALEFANDFLSRYPQSRKLRHSLARHLADEGLYQEAIAQYEEIGDAESEYMQGTLYERANHLDVAREKFLLYHDLQPENQQVFISLAEIALKRKNYDEAGNWISLITNRNLIFSRNLLLAKYVAGTQDIEEAVVMLAEHPVESQQQRIRIILVMEGLYREAGLLEQAMSVLDAGLEEFPGNSTLLIAKSYTAAELKYVDQVEDVVNEILAQQPENALALNALGYTLIDLTDRLEEGTRYIERALALRPNDPYILDSMGWAHYKLGNYRSAVEFLEKAIARRDDPVMAAHLGEVYWTLGKTRKARRIWNQAREKSPDNEILIETIERLTGQ